jgi:hypothetical protein
MGLEVRTTKRFHPEGLMFSNKLHRGVHLYPHAKWDEPPYLQSGSKGCLMFPNLSLIWPRVSTKGLISSRIMLPPSTRRHPYASFKNRLIAISYLAYQPHLWYVVCMGGYSDSLSQRTVFNSSVSYITLRSNTHSDLTPHMSKGYQIDHQIYIPSWGWSLVIFKITI